MRPHVPPWRLPSREALPLAAAILLLAALRALVAARMPLTDDEAYYRLWGLAPAMSYLDHPPMVGWMIAAGVWAAGDCPLGIRLPALLATLVGPFVLWRAAHVLFAAVVARRAVWFCLAMPLLAAGSVVVTPDTPSVLFWGLAGWALAELHVSRAASWWLAVGLFAGLGLLSKYSNLFVGAGIVLWLALLPANWHWFRSWQLWAGGALAALLALPVLIWNAEHGWASFAKQLGRVAAGEGLSLVYLGEFLGGYMGLASPLIAILAVRGLWTAGARAVVAADLERAMLVLGMLPFLAWLLQHALHDRVQPNWAAPLYPALAVCAALAVEEPRSQRRPALVQWGLALGFAISALIYAHALRPTLPLPVTKDPTAQLRGWAALAREIDRLRAAHGACWIATSSYATTGQLAYALRTARTPVLQLDEPLRYVHLPPADERLDKCPALYAELERRQSPALLSSRFRSVERLANVTREHEGVPVASYAVYRLANPIAPLPGR
jgi:4-amino-4-deoxy-L-arabinose transferase-like glycosyltransferase